MDKHFFIGVDLGGTKTEVAVLDAEHRFLLR
jgi:N-acetylglucosamine kinase-like BadF-type ATPase